MNAGQILQLVSIVVSGLSASGLVAAWMSRRSRTEREEQMRHSEAERDNLNVTAAATILKSLRDELNEAYKDIERRRSTIQTQEEYLETQQRQIRKCRRTLENLREHTVLLEEWAQRAQKAVDDQINLPPVPRIGLDGVQELD